MSSRFSACPTLVLHPHGCSFFTPLTSYPKISVVHPNDFTVVCSYVIQLKRIYMCVYVRVKSVVLYSLCVGRLGAQLQGYPPRFPPRSFGLPRLSASHSHWRTHLCAPMF
ncbi:hypothetical protein, unlikely [Trypanosoma brucei gambiense DAL972]|uniref:Uncharacterized protein n=1 Tax=Trypanosoma brucei gambiense (strain MHOM/CI/86/DAL972) TaxID=679716 RepID=D0A1L9_TRYB9|nr:hypothetical protein, unlikely [Trypanosoma brucei gambiense DAL972]CBH15161.1 hypothetical protein, unlikely [Trypanosoma brucei gambiense DAL972]|eukprot:XP_011777427.1 hypothetical protein, unlikely [Trypanosoma brucei gambiense DAL972]